MRITTAQFTMNAGIYSPELAEREDTEAYYASVVDMMNMRPKAEGGADLREALVHAGMMRGVVTAIDLSAAVFTAPGDATVDEEGGEDIPPAGDPDPPAYPGDPNPDKPFFPPYDTIEDIP
jgi:hypothetical protein